MYYILIYEIYLDITDRLLVKPPWSFTENKLSQLLLCRFIHQ